MGPYEILARAGAGGMGEVWKARDTRLDRIVAIKFSLDQFSERFEREARAIAALNHPNIAQIYDVGANYLVMEYIDGEPLCSPGNVRKVLDLAVQIADGLAAAHAAGFVHRDLKPGNILLTRDGRVKILDFGLVKQPAIAAAHDETATLLSDPGTIVGTAAYMSPEQARGQQVDFRSDQFSFGLVLYEMLTGRRAFQRPSAVETMTAIINEDFEPLPAAAPAALRWTVERCLSKDPGQRYDSTADLFRDLRQIRDHLSEAHVTVDNVAPVRRRPWRKFVIAAAALAFFAGGAAMASWLANRGPESPQWLGSKLGGPGIAMRPAISPDGKLLAFSAMVDGQTQLAVMQPDSGNWTVLTHDRSSGMQAQMSWAPDGSQIYFDRVWGGPRGIYAISPLGGEPRLVLDAAQCPHALPDGSLIVVQMDAPARYRLYRLWPDSGKLQPLPALVGGGVRQLVNPLVQPFPDGRGVVYLGTPDSKPDGPPRWYVIDLTTLRSRPLNGQVVAGAYGVSATPDNRSALIINPIGDEWSIAAVPRSGVGDPRPLITFPKPHNVWGMDAARDGSVYFDYMLRQESVLEFDTGAQVPSEAVTTLDGLTLLPLGGGSFLIDGAEGGKRRLKVFRAGIGSRNLLESSEESSGPAARVGAGAVAFVSRPAGGARLAIATLREGRLVKRFAFDAAPIECIAATPDGEWLYFSTGGHVLRIGVQEEEGAKPVVVTQGDSVAVDGKYLYVTRTGTGRRQLLRIPIAGGQAEGLRIPPEYTLSDDALSPAAVDAAGRILFEVDSPDSWYERVAMLDTSRDTFAVVSKGFSGDMWMPAWDGDGRIAAIGARLDSTLWRYRPLRGTR